MSSIFLRTYLPVNNIETEILDIVQGYTNISVKAEPIPKGEEGCYSYLQWTIKTFAAEYVLSLYVGDIWYKNVKFVVFCEYVITQNIQVFCIHGVYNVDKKLGRIWAGRKERKLGRKARHSPFEIL